MYSHQYDQWQSARMQDATEEMIRMRQPVAPVAPRVKVETADGFLVVSRERICRYVIPPYRYGYHYDHFDREADATEFYGEIADGRYNDTREAVAVVPCKRGVPLGSKVIL